MSIWRENKGEKIIKFLSLIILFHAPIACREIIGRKEIEGERRKEEVEELSSKGKDGLPVPKETSQSIEFDASSSTVMFTHGGDFANFSKKGPSTAIERDKTAKLHPI